MSSASGSAAASRTFWRPWRTPVTRFGGYWRWRTTGGATEPIMPTASGHRPGDRHRPPGLDTPPSPRAATGADRRNVLVMTHNTIMDEPMMVKVSRVEEAGLVHLRGRLSISFTRVLRIARRTATGTAGFPPRTGTTSYPTPWPTSLPRSAPSGGTGPARARSNAPTTTATASTRSPQAAHATPRSTPAYTTVEVGLCDNSRRRFGSQRRRYVRQHYNPRAVETPWQQRCVMQFQR